MMDPFVRSKEASNAQEKDAATSHGDEGQNDVLGLGRIWLAWMNGSISCLVGNTRATRFAVRLIVKRMQLAAAAGDLQYSVEKMRSLTRRGMFYCLA